MGVTRRTLVLGGLCGLAGAGRAADQLLRPTPLQSIGPFYPVSRPLDQDADLTSLGGRSERAVGTIINIVGRIIDRAGQPVPRAKIDIWQANAAGRYGHPGDNSDLPIDPNFQGSAVISADEQGRYRFRTVKPGAYLFQGAYRTPHIHFDVVGTTHRLVTQLYFPGESLNETDLLFRDVAAPAAREALTARPLPPLADDPTIPAFGFDIILGMATV